jgi:hypothetical protein
MENITIDNIFVKQIKQLLEQNAEQELRQLLDNMYEQDIAEF